MSKKYDTIFLDQDGVLARFTAGVITTLNPLLGSSVTYNDIIERGEWQLEKSWGLSQKEWWDNIDRNINFWLEIPPFEWCNDLYKRCKPYANEVVILTAPSRNPLCIPHKIEWVHKHMGLSFDNVVPTRKKYLLSRRNTLLIDDSQKNVDDFNKGDGEALLIPSDWNTKKLTFEMVWGVIDDKINS